MKITGEIVFIGVNYDEGQKPRHVITLLVPPEKIETVVEKYNLKQPEDGFDHCPLKYNEKRDCYTFKLSSIYDIPVFEGDKPSGIGFEEIGRGSKVMCSFNMKEQEYRRKKSQVAYLTAINIIDYLEPEDFNPFTDDSDEGFDL